MENEPEMTLNQTFEGRTEAGDHLFTAEDALESPNSILEIDCTHVTKHSLATPSHNHLRLVMCWPG